MTERALQRAGIIKMVDDQALLREALNELTRRERLVCIWKIAGFSTRDIAHHLRRSEASVDSIFARAKRKLRRALPPKKLKQ